MPPSSDEARRVTLSAADWLVRGDLSFLGENPFADSGHNEPRAPRVVGPGETRQVRSSVPRAYHGSETPTGSTRGAPIRPNARRSTHPRNELKGILGRRDGMRPERGEGMLRPERRRARASEGIKVRRQAPDRPGGRLRGPERRPRRASSRRVLGRILRRVAPPRGGPRGGQGTRPRDPPRARPGAQQRPRANPRRRVRRERRQAAR